MLGVVAAIAALALTIGGPSGGSKASAAPAQGIHKIKHVVVVMQENRSFDEYFGTYPGVDGIPAGVCVPDPVTAGCDRPFHDAADLNRGGPHTARNAAADINDGQMDGFVGQAQLCRRDRPACLGRGRDVMGYKTGRDIPNYWSYARNFVLQDHMFEPAASWSLPSHLFMVSAWSADCSNSLDVSTCTSSLAHPDHDLGSSPDYGWT